MQTRSAMQSFLDSKICRYITWKNWNIIDYKKMQSKSCLENSMLEVWNSMQDAFTSVKNLVISLLTFSHPLTPVRFFLVLNDAQSKARNRVTENDSEAPSN